MCVYSLQMFRSLARKFANSSTVDIDPSKDTDKSLPPRGDEDGRRGWRNHGRLGMAACLKHWAQGRSYRIAFMLAEMAVQFNVVNQVCVCDESQHMRVRWRGM